MGKGILRQDNRIDKIKSSVSCYPVKKIRNPKSAIPGIPLSRQKKYVAAFMNQST